MLYSAQRHKDDGMMENLMPEKKLTQQEVIRIERDLAKFAKIQGVNYKILKIHNPWLRDKKLTNTSGKKYEIEIPTSGYNKQ